MNKQPGVMLYFDLLPSLERFTLEEQGLLFRAILEYGKLGLTPHFHGALAVAWDFIQPRLDRDWARYEEVSEKRSQAAQLRWGQTGGPGRTGAPCGDANACK